MVDEEGRVTLIVTLPRNNEFGRSRTGLYRKTYAVWKEMIKRCHNPNHVGYKNYGGRGITVCDRWRESFTNFIQDMGPQPEKLSIERLDNSKGYQPGNCAWVTQHVQSRNRRVNKLFTHDGRTMPICDWFPILGLTAAAFYDRQRKGLTVEQALLTPKRPGKKLRTEDPTA